MRFLKFTSDKIVRRLRWLVVGIIVFDAVITLLGQPSTYWHDYQTALEGNPAFRQYLCQGYAPFCLAMLIYAAFAFCLVSILPRRAGQVTAFAYLFAHFFSTESWLMLRWHFSGNGLMIYGILLGVAVVMLAFPKPTIQDSPQTPPNTSLEPTGVDAGNSAARSTSQFAGGSTLDR